jgi:nicotinate-nucleotide adenylyltransferase
MLMRIGVFGGSFDPVHLGHLRLADCCWRQARLDRVDFIPTAQQPLKPHGPVASEADRIAMLRLALADRPGFAVSNLEIERGGVSYTVDTLRAVREAWPKVELFFLMGADALAEFPQWREPEAICELATLLVVRRAGATEPDFGVLNSIVSPARLAEIRDVQVQMPATPISSTAIRELIAKSGTWRESVPEKVADYILQHELYGCHRA